jgi:protein-S-isoprenylcysteine O-methyltransferase Ste14
MLVPVGEIVTIIGAVMCLISTISLGKYFGVLPIYRGVQKGWAYRFIRHPIYLSYIVLDAGILLSYGSFRNSLIFLIGVLLFVLRIRYEEKILVSSEDYLQYKKKVKYKLIPKIYWIRLKLTALIF